MNENKGFLVTGGSFELNRMIADPIYGFVEITRNGPWGKGEQELLDSPWLQRARYIHQLQASWWVFPSAEHSRFVHLLGAMHLAGKMGKQVYESLKLEFPETPGKELVEEVLRLAGLLHDIGHGPFGHFFDRQVLKKYGIDHEVIGRELILGPLAEAIRGIRLSPSGFFQRGEQIDPLWVAWLMANPEIEGFTPPLWLKALKPILCGPVTVDNMDYVVRDAYMCGIKVNVDVERIIHYTFIHDGTIVLHEHAVPALQSFLQTRLHLYNSVYYHRTSKRFEISMKEIFSETVALMGIKNPLDNMERYLELNDWLFLETVKEWARNPKNEQETRLGKVWEKIISRDVPWRLAFEITLPSDYSIQNLQNTLRNEVGNEAKFVIDITNIATVSPNPMRKDGFIGIWDPLRGIVSPTNVQLLSRLPNDGLHIRVFTDTPRFSNELREAARRILGS